MKFVIPFQRLIEIWTNLSVNWAIPALLLNVSNFSVLAASKLGMLVLCDGYTIDAFALFSCFCYSTNCIKHAIEFVTLFPTYPQTIYPKISRSIEKEKKRKEENNNRKIFYGNEHTRIHTNHPSYIWMKFVKIVCLLTVSTTSVPCLPIYWEMCVQFPHICYRPLCCFFFSFNKLIFCLFRDGIELRCI